MPVRSRSRASSVEQEVVAVLVDRAQLVELGVVAGGDHAAVAHQRRGLRRDGARQQRRPSRIDGADRPSSVEQQRRRRCRRARRAAPAARAACRAGRRDRAGARCAARCAQRCARRRSRARSVCAQRLDAVRGLLAPARDRGVPRAAASLRAQRVREPVAQQRGCPCRVAQVSSSESSVGAASPRSVSRDLEVAAGRGVSVSSSLARLDA